MRSRQGLVLAAALGLVALFSTHVGCRVKGTAPLADSDGDSILDRCDRCPTVPEDYDQTQDDDGCPEAVTVQASHHPFAERVYFTEGDAALARSQQAVLRAALASLKTGQTHALSCVGTFAPREAGGLALARQRAEALRGYFAARGIARERVKVYATAELGARLLAAHPGRREIVRHVAMVASTVKAAQWYQRPLELLRWDGRRLVPTGARAATRPSGPAVCPPRRD